jgi:hypothetical protein
MKMIPLFAALLSLTFTTGLLAEGVPKIQFEKTVYDFGAVSQVPSVAGTFKFKNVGDAVLKLQPPKPSCGCTLAELKSDTLQPGESGELSFTMSLGLSKAHIEKHITVPSNDPQNPNFSLSIKVEYTPLYDLSPLALGPVLPLDVQSTNLTTTITRTDGAPLGTLRFVSSQPWISARVESPANAKASTALIRVQFERNGVARRFNESVLVYQNTDTNTAISTILISGQMLGQISLSPEILYWSITDAAKIKPGQDDPRVARRLTIRSADGKAFALKNPVSSLKDVNVNLVPIEEGRAYQLVASLAEIPAKTISGNISFETSVPAQSRIEVPMIVNVFTP